MLLGHADGHEENRTNNALKQSKRFLPNCGLSKKKKGTNQTILLVNPFLFVISVPFTLLFHILTTNPACAYPEFHGSYCCQLVLCYITHLVSMTKKKFCDVTHHSVFTTTTITYNHRNLKMGKPVCDLFYITEILTHHSTG